MRGVHMRHSGGRLARAVAGTVVLLALVGCGQQQAEAGKSEPRAPKSKVDLGVQGRAGKDTPDGGVALTLDDGREVTVRHVRGKGLYERHRAPGGDGWSAPRLVYRTAEHGCDDLRVRASGGTVAVFANFGYYCYDGEPPEDSLAAVATGDLTRWDRSVTKRVDGWRRAGFVDEARQVTFSFRNDAGLSTVVWVRGEGFAKPDIAGEPPTPVPGHFLGEWRLSDGSQRMVITRSDPGKGLAVFTMSGGPRCVAEVDVALGEDGNLTFVSDAAVVEGKERTNCPPDTEITSLVRKGGDTLELTLPGELEPPTRLTYLRAGS